MMTTTQIMEAVAPIAARGAFAASFLDTNDENDLALAQSEMINAQAEIKAVHPGLRVRFGMDAQGVAFCSVSTNIWSEVWTVS